MARARDLLRTVRDRPALQVALGLVGILGILLLWLVWPYASAFGDIRADRDDQPSRLYGRAMVISPGDPIPRSAMIEKLVELRLRAQDEAPIAPGRFRLVNGDQLVVHLPSRVHRDGRAQARRVEIGWNNGAVAWLRTDGIRLESLTLPPPLVASYYGEGMREVFPVQLETLPEHVVDAVLAAEDDGFYQHLGLSPSGIGRALVVNVREGEIEQGGSTITQQLVKNVFLNQERTLARKVREALLAVLVEMQHPKERILQAYLNQIYLGTSDGVNFHGIGAAAWALYGRRAEDLTVDEAATIAGMIRSPGDFSPLHDPEAARSRRDLVLERMRKLGRIDDETLASARERPIALDPGELGRNRAPYFKAAVRQEAAARFGLRRLGGRGYQIFSTLDPGEQRHAERAVREQLDALGGGDLQGTLLSVDPRSGAVLAYVGGRSFGDSEFDRVRKARRQPGSAFKPVVFAAAVEAIGATPVTRLRDSPIRVETGSDVWTPKNFDGYHVGLVTARKALEQSLNVPVVRLALETGLEQVASMAHRLGLEDRPDSVPSLALGSVEASAWEMATIYSAFATSGIRPHLHGLDRALDAEGNRLHDPDPPPAEGEQVITPTTAYLVSSVLQGAVQRGTGRRALSYGVPGPIAGKTGTSNEGRDAWFVGYRPDRVTVAWVGYDDPRDSRFTGSRAALPIWGQFSAGTLPPTDAVFETPEGLAPTVVCIDSGRIPRLWCPTRVEELLPPGAVPTQECDLHLRKRLEPRTVKWPSRVGGWLQEKLEDLLGDG